MLVLDGRGRFRRRFGGFRRIRYDLFRTVGIGNIALRIVLIHLGIARRSGFFLLLGGGSFRAGFALVPLRKRRRLAAEIILILLLGDGAAVAAVEIGVFVENAVRGIAVPVRHFRRRRTAGGRGRTDARRMGVIPRGRLRIRRAAVAARKAVHIGRRGPVSVQDRVPLRIGGKGLLRLLHRILCGAALLLCPARFLPHFAAGFKVKLVADREQALGAVNGIGFGILLNALLRARRSGLPEGLRRLRRGLLRVRLLFGTRGRVVPIVCARSVARGIIDESAFGRGLFLFALRTAAAGRVQQICRRRDEQRKDDVPADRRRQLDDGIDDEPEDDAARRGKGKTAVFLPARTGAVTIRQIIAVTAVFDACGGRGDGMHETHEANEQKHAKPRRFSRNGEFFARDENKAEIDERREERIGAIAERAQQKGTDGEPDAPEYDAARYHDDKGKQREQFENDTHRFARQDLILVFFIIFTSSPKVIQKQTLPSRGRGAHTEIIFFRSLFLLYHFFAYISIKMHDFFRSRSNFMRARI